MRMLSRFLLLLIVCNVYSQKQDFTPIPVKPIRSYQVKINNVDGKNFYLYNEIEHIPLSGKYKIALFFLDKSKKDSLINDNGKLRKTLQFDTKYSNYSRLNIYVIGEFVKGYKNGLWKTLYKNKLVKTINYRNGLVIGRYRVYNTKGAILYKTTFGAKGNGKFEDYYYKTGALKQEGNYKNGKKEGEWCDYNELGETTKITVYNKGMPQE